MDLRRKVQGGAGLGPHSAAGTHSEEPGDTVGFYGRCCSQHRALGGDEQLERQSEHLCGDFVGYRELVCTMWLRPSSVVVRGAI